MDLFAKGQYIFWKASFWGFAHIFQYPKLSVKYLVPIKTKDLKSWIIKQLE